MFKSVTCKLGNMKKDQRWVIYPPGEDKNLVMIQCDKRIAQVNLTTGKAILSDGKNGHNGFVKLSKFLGAMDVDVPADVLKQLQDNPVPSGPVILLETFSSK